MRFIVCTFFYFLFLIPANAILSSGLSENTIKIHTNFTGKKLLLFGAFESKTIPEKNQIIIIIKGPSQAFTIRKKEKKFGVWVNSDTRLLNKAPTYYSTFSNQPLHHLSPQLRQKHNIGLEYLPITTQIPIDKEFINGFIKIKQQQKLYLQSEDSIEIIQKHLFKLEINLPSNTPLGVYSIKILRLHSGQLKETQHKNINVTLTGLEYLIYHLAYQYSILYGIICVITALLLGFLGALIFRRSI